MKLFYNMKNCLLGLHYVDTRYPNPGGTKFGHFDIEIKRLSRTNAVSPCTIRSYMNWAILKVVQSGILSLKVAGVSRYLT